MDIEISEISAVKYLLYLTKRFGQIFDIFLPQGRFELTSEIVIWVVRSTDVAIEAWMKNLLKSGVY